MPSSTGYLAIDGCTAGFCIASYEGTKEEQAVLQRGVYRVETVFKVRFRHVQLINKHTPEWNSSYTARFRQGRT